MTEQHRLNSWVHVRRSDQDPGAWFGPDDYPLPQWVIDQLADNPRVWRTDEDETQGPPASPLMGSTYEPGSMVSTPEVRVGHQPSTASRPHRSAGSSAASAAGADRGLAEAERRFGPPPSDAA